MRRRDGGVRYVSWSASWSAELGVNVAVARDVTRLVEHEAELERRVAERTRELELANEELEAFSYSVSHDLRKPLRAIEGFSRALLEEFAPRLDERGRGEGRSAVTPR